MNKALLIFLMLLIGCKKETPEMEINYFDTGIKQSIKLNENAKESIFEIIDELISNSNDILKLLVNNSTIEEIKKNEKAIEIIFSKEQLFTSKELGAEKIKKLFFPLTGDFIGDNNDQVITIFLGEDEYFTGPYRNDKGFSKLKELEKLILYKSDN